MSGDEQEKIASEYYESLDKPEAAKEGPEFALCIIGLVGAGKSTVLNKLLKLVPMARQSGDEIRKLLYEKGLPEADSATIAGINERVVGLFVDNGYRVAYDNDFGNPAIRAKMETWNRRRNIPIVWIRINTPEDFILKKLRSFGRTYLFSDGEEAVVKYFERKALHAEQASEFAKLPFVYTFDTSRGDLDAQVAEAAIKIRKQAELLALQYDVSGAN
jgi:predicted kinase